MQALAQYCRQRRLPLLRHADVLPQRGRGGFCPALPKVARRRFFGQRLQGLLLGLQSQQAAFGFSRSGLGSLKIGFQAARLLFQRLQSLFGRLILRLYCGGGLLGGGQLVGCGQIERGGFLLQTRLLRLNAGDAAAAVLQLLLLERQLAADAVGFVLLVLLGGGALLLRGFEFGQPLFAGLCFFGQQQKLRFQLFGFVGQRLRLLAQEFLLVVDFLHGGGHRGAVALDALALVLPRADLFFQTGALLAQQRVFAVEPVLRFLLFGLGGTQRLHRFVQRLLAFGQTILPGLRLLVFGGGGIGIGQRLAPAGEVVAVLAVLQFVAQRPIVLGGLGLLVQLFHLPREFALQIGQPLQMLAGVFEPAFGFAAALFVFGNARRLFDIGAQFLRPRFDNPRNHALLDHCVAARADAGAQKQIGDVAAAHRLAVDVVARFALAGELAADADFGILPPRALQAVVAVVEYQFHRRPGRRPAGGSTVENHVLHALAAQLLG